MGGEHIYCQEKCPVEKIAHICGNYTAESYIAETYTAEKIYCRKLYCRKNILLKIIQLKVILLKNHTAEKIVLLKIILLDKIIRLKIILLKIIYCRKNLYCSKLYLWKRLYCWRTKNYLLKEIILFDIYALTKAPQWLISFQSFTNFSSSKTNFELPSSCFIRISCTSSNIHHVNIPTTLRDFCLSESWNTLFNLMMFAD